MQCEYDIALEVNSYCCILFVIGQSGFETLKNARGFVSWPKNCAATSSLDNKFVRQKVMRARL